MGDLMADAGLGMYIHLTGWSVRFWDFDSEEVNDPVAERRFRAFEARGYLRILVAKGDTLTVQSYSFDKYGRRIDGIPHLADGTDLCELMRSKGFQKEPR